MISIIIAYGAGTSRMLDCCLTSLGRHRAGVDYQVILGTDEEVAAMEANDVSEKFGIKCRYFDVGIAPTGSGRHARILNAALPLVKTERLLTLDSDCLIVSDGWLKELSDMLDNGAAVAGVLWPWVPPPVDLDPKLIEYKIRKHHNWNNTHVACQMTRMSFIHDHDLNFGGLYDTGLKIPHKAHELGLPVVGWKPTCCAKPAGSFDTELNRLVCVVHGDRVYHHGGATRQVAGNDVCWQEFDAARCRVLEEKSADWILEPGNCYRYKLDREEEVAQYKMQMHYAAMYKYLETHDRLFGEGWW